MHSKQYPIVALRKFSNILENHAACMKNNTTDNFLHLLPIALKETISTLIFHLFF